MIRKAKAGDVETALLIEETIGFQVQMEVQTTEPTQQVERDEGSGFAVDEEIDFM